MRKDSFENLIDFIVKQCAVDPTEVTRDARIEDDLGVYGDDAMELLVAFGKSFDVDVSKFMARDYFSAEGDKILPAIIRVFTNKKKVSRKVLTVGHLEKAIIAGRLDEEVIET